MTKAEQTTPRSLYQTGGGRINAAHQVFDAARSARRWYLDQTRWTVTVDSTDKLYDTAHTWFASTGIDTPRSVLARLSTASGSGMVESSDSPTPDVPEVRLYWNVRHDRRVDIAGHSITISMSTPETSPGGRGDFNLGRMRDPDAIHFHARNRAGQEAVIAMLTELARRTDERPPALHLFDNYGNWARRDDLPARPLESVILPEGQLERLVGDFEQFLSSESDYIRRGLPYHRGYLLHGRPGTGKTSVIRALAATLRLNLWYAPLGDMTKDATLLQLINRVGPRSILLLEDVDIFASARERHTEGDRAVTMAGLLNALDGVATPHGLITVLTTNDIDAIDPALLRPGRVDVREEFGYAAAPQLARLWAFYYDQPIPDTATGWDEHVSVPPADAIEMFRRTPRADTALYTLRHWKAGSKL